MVNGYETTRLLHMSSYSVEELQQAAIGVLHSEVPTQQCTQGSAGKQHRDCVSVRKGEYERSKHK